MDEKPRGRWLRFTVRTLLMLVAVVAVSLGWITREVGQRKQTLNWIEENGGYVDRWYRPEPIVIDAGELRIIKFDYQRVLGREEEPSIPRWREWLGDVSVNRMLLPRGSTESDLDRAKAMFPEAEVELPMEPVVGSGFGF